MQIPNEISKLIVELIKQSIEGTGSWRVTLFSYITFVTIITLLFPQIIFTDSLLKSYTIVYLLLMFLLTVLYIFNLKKSLSLGIPKTKKIRKFTLNITENKRIIYNNKKFISLSTEILLKDIGEDSLNLRFFALNQYRLKIFDVNYVIGKINGSIGIGFESYGSGKDIEVLKEFNLEKPINLSVLNENEILMVTIWQDEAKSIYKASIPENAVGDLYVKVENINKLTKIELNKTICKYI